MARFLDIKTTPLSTLPSSMQNIGSSENPWGSEGKSVGVAVVLYLEFGAGVNIQAAGIAYLLSTKRFEDKQTLRSQRDGGMIDSKLFIDNKAMTIPSSDEILPAPGIHIYVVEMPEYLAVSAWRWQCLTGRGDTSFFPGTSKHAFFTRYLFTKEFVNLRLSS